MRTHPTLAVVIVASLAGLAGAGCKGGAMNKPIKTSPIENGPDTIKSVQLQLKGTWNLLSLDLTSQAGKRVTVPATGVLEADEFGNLNIEYKFSDAGMKALATIDVQPRGQEIAIKGRTEIDTTGKAIRYVSEDVNERRFDPDLAAARANPFALERTRYYQFQPDGTLRLATHHDDGKEALVSRWKKG
jgi:hypothetical protein